MTDRINNRLFVTGHTDAGRATFVADKVAVTTPLCGEQVTAQFLWARNDVPTFPDDGSVTPMNTALPLPGGCSFSTLTIAAGATDDYHAFIVNAMGELADPDQPGFHKTPTLDFIIVLEGELTLELDDDAERVLRRGDSAVLNGVRHRWHNRSTGDARLAAVMLGARVRTV